MEEISCIFCNGSNDEVVIEENGYMGRKCHLCGLIYVSPRPTRDEIVDMYSDDHGLTSAQMHILYPFVRKLHARHNLKIVSKHRSNGNLLEIGAGGGYFLEEARKKGYLVFGIEPNRTAAHYINNSLRIPCEENSINRYSYGNKTFEIIYHCNVLSHLYDPIDEFRKIHDKLTDCGILVFETGNIGEVEEKYFPFFYSFGFPDHLFFYSDKSIRTLLHLTNFEVIAVYKYSILNGLKINKYKQRLGRIIGSGLRVKKSPTVDKEGKGAYYNADGSIMRALKGAFRSTTFLIDYKLGSLTNRKGCPQTVIVVASKKTKT